MLAQHTGTHSHNYVLRSPITLILQLLSEAFKNEVQIAYTSHDQSEVFKGRRWAKGCCCQQPYSCFHTVCFKGGSILSQKLVPYSAQSQDICLFQLLQGQNQWADDRPQYTQKNKLCTLKKKKTVGGGEGKWGWEKAFQ